MRQVGLLTTTLRIQTVLYSDNWSEYKAPTQRASATHIPHKITQKGNIPAQHAQDPKTILSSKNH